MIRDARGFIISASLALLVTSAHCQAQELYNFVQAGTGDVLATLDLTVVPATHTDVAGLTFSTKGEGIFGLGATYSGTFDLTSESTVSETLPSNLGCTSCIRNSFIDSDPPMGFDTFALWFDNDLGEDAIFLNTGVGVVRDFGDWIAVPEPATSTMSVFALVLLGAFRSRHTR